MSCTPRAGTRPHRRPTAFIPRVAAGVVAALIVALLIGCGGPDTEPASTTVAGSASATVSGRGEAAAPGTRASRAVAVTTRVATPRKVVDRAQLPGSLAPVRRATLGSEVEGRVDAVRVEVGDAVARGDLLATVDQATLRQSLAEAEAVDRQRKAQRDRAEKLFERRAITQQQLLDATTEQEVAAARLARAGLALAQSRLVAPWRGTVAQRRITTGDFVKVGQAMFELIDTRRLEARAQAPASDAPSLRVGLEATVTVEGFGDEPVVGTVTRLGAELDPASHTLAVVVAFDNPDNRYRPGSLARIGLPRRTYEAAITVPLAALVELEASRAVFVVDADGRAERRPVTLGPVLGAEVVVEEGLAAGERVVIAGQRQLSPGQVVHEADRAAMFAVPDPLPPGPPANDGAS